MTEKIPKHPSGSEYAWFLYKVLFLALLHLHTALVVKGGLLTVHGKFPGGY